MLLQLLRKIFYTFQVLTLSSFCNKIAFANEVSLNIPKLKNITFTLFNYIITGQQLLQCGLLICLIGIMFGMYHFYSIKKLPTYSNMKDIAELIYQTCKSYLIVQSKFVIRLEILLAIIIFIYFRLIQNLSFIKVTIILFCNIIGILGSYFVAWFGMRINNYANARTAFASLQGNPIPMYIIPIKAGISIGTLLISIELFIMLIILLFIPANLSGVCFIGFAIGESLGAMVLRIAGGIFTKIADIGSDLMKIVFNIKEDDARNPGVIADCVGDNAGDSVGPTADGFETYGVTGVAIITFIMLAVKNINIQSKLLIWIFVMRLMMLVSSIVAYELNIFISKKKYNNNCIINFEVPLTLLVWMASLISIILTFVISKYIIGDLGDGTIWYKLSTIISCGTISSSIIPEIVKIFTSTKSMFVKNIINASKHGGASLNILSGLTVGNFSAYWITSTIVILMSIAYTISLFELNSIMSNPSIFAFGLVAFGFLGIGPIIIAIDSYGPVVDNAQSIYQLSLIETIPDINKQFICQFGFKPNFDKAKKLLEKNDSAGNTFKATAKPVLIGTAVTGATIMIFSTITILTKNFTTDLSKLSILYAPFLLGLIMGGAIIYWFTGATNHAVTSGAYKAIKFIKNNIKLNNQTNMASKNDSKQVVQICTKYAQKGTMNLFLVIFFATLAFAFTNPYFFIGYLISIALFGLLQAIFMANAGGAWDNAKKLVESNLENKDMKLYEAVIVGDTVGDPFKDTSAVSINPIIKFTTLFGLIALELALQISNASLRILLVIIFISATSIFVIKSFRDLCL
ncbi:MAG: sodium-translocating pyrophosphatase [Endomicrobium sp.]|jgi:K(+)-stimulated pyrophosphate-energized sodium pump|nr:sodium-translocating pyrophosphatase [Endomicrobium sp.]